MGVPMSEILDDVFKGIKEILTKGGVEDSIIDSILTVSLSWASDRKIQMILSSQDSTTISVFHKLQKLQNSHLI
jgi:hypothetical protein